MSYSYYTPSELRQLFTSDYSNEIKNVIDSHNKIFSSMYQGDLINQMCCTDIHYFMVGLNLTIL